MNSSKKKTYKKNYAPKNCIAVLYPDSSINNNNVTGTVEFIQKDKYLYIKYSIKNLSDGEHGFHIHKCGDLTKQCSSACEHFNPDNNDHGGLHAKNSHAGDLGNIISKNNLSQGIIKTNKITLTPGKKSIVGRMIIVHQDRDDNGKGGNAESLITGNAGKRLACGVIGIK